MKLSKRANREYYEKNKVELRAKARIRRKLNYRKDPEKIKEQNKEWIQKSKYWIEYRKKYNDKAKKNDEDYRERNQLKVKVRKQTQWKYGKTPKGYEYHHIEPYNKDNFILISKEEHKQLHNEIK